MDLFNLSLLDQEFHLNVLAVKLNVNIIGRANVNLAVGADLEYQAGKRYTFWLHILDLKSGSSEMDLIDERFGFQFYVMGTLGFKAGVKKFDTDITIPVVWTNMSQSELNEKFTATVAVGNLTDGYQTVWTGRYGRVDVFDLPTQEEILELMGYYNYETDSGNLKYASVEGYQDQSTGLSLTGDKTFYFNVTPKTYTLTVRDVQDEKGQAVTSVTVDMKFAQEYGGTQVTADTVFTGTANQPLYAHWEKKQELTADQFTFGNLPQTTTYNGTAQAFTFEVNAPGVSQDSFTVEYKLDSGTGEWTTQAPTDAGSYLVKLTRPGDDQYLPFELVVNNSTVALQINKEPVEKPQKSQLNYTFSNWNIKITKTPNIETDGKVIYKLYVIPEAVGEFQYIATFESTSFSVPEASRIIASGNQANPIYGIAVQSLEGRNYAASEESDIKSVIVDSSGNPTTIPLGVLPSTDTYSADSTVSSLSCTVPVAPKVSALATQNVGNTPLMPLSPEQVCLNRGKEFQITLDLNQTTDVWGILANVDYDIETLELTSYTLGNMFTQEQYRVQEDLTAAPFRLLATLEIGTTSAQGAFVTLNFKVKETAQEKDTVISLSRL